MNDGDYSVGKFLGGIMWLLVLVVLVLATCGYCTTTPNT